MCIGGNRFSPPPPLLGKVAAASIVGVRGLQSGDALSHTPCRVCELMREDTAQCVRAMMMTVLNPALAETLTYTEGSAVPLSRARTISVIEAVRVKTRCSTILIFAVNCEGFQLTDSGHSR